MPSMSLGSIASLGGSFPIGAGTTFGSFRFREKSGSTSAVQLASAECSTVNIKALADNAGKVYVGNSSSVTKADGTSDDTSGWPLAAGEFTGWMPAANLNEIWIICDNAGDDIVIMYA